MGDVTYEDYQDLVRKLSLANERVRDFQERVSGRDARIAALEAQLAEVRKAIDKVLDHITILKAAGFRVLGPDEFDQVTNAIVEATVQAIRQYTRDTLLIDEHRELVRTALKAAMEAGR